MRRFVSRILRYFEPVFKIADRHFNFSVSYAREHGKLFLLWGGAGALFLGGVTVLWAATLDIPDLSSLESRVVEQSVKIYDRTGSVLLYDLHGNMQRTIIPLSAISPDIEHAVLAIEDPEFYNHSGIKHKAIVRAIVMNLAGGDLMGQGGSTVTQQVVKLTVLTSDKTITRKLKEWVLALKMNRALTKDQVLEIYLNQMPFAR